MPSFANYHGYTRVKLDRLKHESFRGTRTFSAVEKIKKKKKSLAVREKKINWGNVATYESKLSQG